MVYDKAEAHFPLGEFLSEHCLTPGWSAVCGPHCNGSHFYGLFVTYPGLEKL
jgi:hypothetical protein